MANAFVLAARLVSEKDTPEIMTFHHNSRFTSGADIVRFISLCRTTRLTHNDMLGCGPRLSTKSMADAGDGVHFTSLEATRDNLGA
jgi:hypothetical protein